MPEKMPRDRVTPGQVWIIPGTDAFLLITSIGRKWWFGMSQNKKLISDKIIKDKRGNEFVAGYKFSHVETKIPEWI